ncbi:hypothetical protein SAMN05518669_12949 [Variovorax sp. YR634]|nr:hypothetical protein SAMN05518669_12949 [Variovorax sp. YR634]
MCCPDSHPPPNFCREGDGKGAFSHCSERLFPLVPDNDLSIAPCIETMEKHEGSGEESTCDAKEQLEKSHKHSSSGRQDECWVLADWHYQNRPKNLIVFSKRASESTALTAIHAQPASPSVQRPAGSPQCHIKPPTMARTAPNEKKKIRPCRVVIRGGILLVPLDLHQRLQLYSAVAGSMTLYTRSTRLAGKPPSSACRRTRSSSVAW